MALTFLTLLALARLPSATPGANLVANPSFEAGAVNWSHWAAAADSGRIVSSSDACHAGKGCLAITQEGSKDWAVWPSQEAVSVHPGEVWKWSAWIRTYGPRADAGLGFVVRDKAGGVLSWKAGQSSVATGEKGWIHFVTRISVPMGCASIQPRLTGLGRARLAMDDASLLLESPAAKNPGDLTIANDSVRLVVDPYDLSMRLSDAAGGEAVRAGSLPAFHLDSSGTDGKTLRLSVRHLSGGWNGKILASLSGGSLRLSLQADSASAVPEDFVFPGSVSTRAGQRIAIPRGTGLAWPVDAAISRRWPLAEARFWEWQVSQSMTGASDGRTGFVVSVDQPSDSRLVLEKDARGLTMPVVRQVASKGVFGHERSAMVAAVRGGGFAEMGRRHRMRQDELGRTRTWTAKIADNPDVARLRGAADWWLRGTAFTWKNFDTLRWMGMENAVIHWTPWMANELDSLRARGWLMSVYDNWSDAFPSVKGKGNPAGEPNGRENPTGAIVQKDGSRLKGYLFKGSDGAEQQALEICSARHPHLARANIAADSWGNRRNAHFVDVEMSFNAQECWSAAHPVDRQNDLENRVRALSVIKDSLHLVTGSEQAREISFAHADYGEGPMSIATVADAGYDLTTPEPPEGNMDSLSMDPSLRVPLLPLTSHDVFSPTWYTGDGQSKVPARWDDKDAWNILYATMPLIAPKDRAMWDSLRTRYLRSIVAIGAYLSRTQFEPMTDFVNLSPDGKVQRTSFSNGWSATVNFDSAVRGEGGFPLPAKGWRASGPDGRVERATIDGATRTRVRLSDRWFLDPEGSEAFVDGIRTSGAVYMKRQDDSTVALSLVGDQDHVDLVPASLPWPATKVHAVDRNSAGAVALMDRGAGTLRLEASAGRFVLLRGDFRR